MGFFNKNKLALTAELNNPKSLLLFSYPKTGKTHNLLQLEDNFFIDFEQGTRLYNVPMGIRLSNDSNKAFNELRDLFKHFKQESPYFKYITLDTLTSFNEELVNYLAIDLYNTDPLATKANDFEPLPYSYDITNLAYGKGHEYKKQVILRIIKFLSEYCDTLIIVSHVRDKSVGQGNSELIVKDIDLAGKLKNALTLKVDTIGLMYRVTDELNDTVENKITFINTEEQTSGSRVARLDNKTFVISKKVGEYPDGSAKIETYWDNIFLKHTESNNKQTNTKSNTNKEIEVSNDEIDLDLSNL